MPALTCFRNGCGSLLLLLLLRVLICLWHLHSHCACLGLRRRQIIVLDGSASFFDVRVVLQGRLLLVAMEYFFFVMPRRPCHRLISPHYTILPVQGRRCFNLRCSRYFRALAFIRSLCTCPVIDVPLHLQLFLASTLQHHHTCDNDGCERNGNNTTTIVTTRTPRCRNNLHNDCVRFRSDR